MMMTVCALNSVPPLMAELVFRGALPWWAVGVLIAVCLGLVGVLYTSEKMKMHPLQRIAMGFFRALALVAIVLLLKKPVLVSEEEATKPLPIALLIDNTQSMKQQDSRLDDADLARAGIALNRIAPDHALTLNDAERSDIRRADPQPSRAKMVEGVFQNPVLRLREELAKKGPLQEYLFGAGIRGAGADWANDLPASESRTALSHSIQQLLKRDDNELPAAIVIASDGLENDREHRVPLEDIGRECKRLGVPLHVYGVGTTTARLLQLRSFESNPRDTLLINSAVTSTFRWLVNGYPPGTEIELAVRLGNKIVATRKRKVKEGEEEMTESLTFVPKKEDISAGRVDLEGSIGIVGGAESERDRVIHPARVVESKVKVLVVESDPRWEFKFLSRALQREKVADAKFVLTSGDDKAVKTGGTENPFLPEFPKTRRELFAYDMLIIGDVAPSTFSPEQQKWIADFVEQGGGLIMMAGRKNNPGGYLNKDSIAKLLPVEFENKPFPLEDTKLAPEFTPQLSDIGRHEPLMSMADSPEENLRIWSKLPGWFWFYPVTKLKPSAQSLLDHPTETIEDPSPLSKDKRRPMPLIARQYYGRGIVMFIASDSTWRWRFNEADKYFARFWGQAVYQLGLPHVLGSKSQLTAEEDFLRGKPTRVFARLFNPDFMPLDIGPGKRLEATLESTKAKEGEKEEKIDFEPVPGQPGLFVATITKDKPGDFTLKLRSPASQGETLALPVRVTVPPDDELARGNLNESLLKRLAESTSEIGGTFYRENDLKDLAANVKAKTVNLNPPPRKEILLWTQWYILAAVIGLLTIEWIVRKFSNLS